ncbi:MAG: VOC family protein [Clostridiales bacterium]|nr:VOC family protein [Clostridiales bacterium]
MGIKAIGHVGFVVSDMKKAIEFYQDKLGFQVVAEMSPPGRQIVFLEISKGQTIELFSGGEETMEISAKTIGYAHTCLIIEDMEKLLEELKEKGVEISGEPRIREDGGGTFRIVDPDGNQFEMMQRGPDQKF